MASWSAGSWIVGAEVRLLQCWSVGSRHGTPVQKQERRGVGRGFARSRSDAKVSLFLGEKIDCLKGECVAYVCVPFTVGVAMYL